MYGGEKLAYSWADIVERAAAHQRGEGGGRAERVGVSVQDTEETAHKRDEETGLLKGLLLSLYLLFIVIFFVF